MYHIYLFMYIYRIFIIDVYIVSRIYIYNIYYLWSIVFEKKTYIIYYVLSLNIMLLYFIYTQRPGFAQRCSVEGSHSQSNVAATLHSIGKISNSTREYQNPTAV